MNYEFSVRPEDFRYAWANAYRMAVLQVIEMHKRADIQLKASYELCNIIEEKSELARDRLMKSSKLIVQNFGTTSERHEKLISLATEKLGEQVNRMKVQDAQLRDQMMGLIRQLSSEREKLEQVRARQFNQPFWRRVWSAIQHS